MVAQVHAREWQADLVGGVTKAHAPAVPFDHDSAALIARLLFRRRPADVVRPIAARIVLSLDGMSQARARADVGEEIFEPAGSAISWIDIDTASTPGVPSLVGSVGRTRNHAGPTMVLAGYLAAGFMAVGCDDLAHTFEPKASARAGSRELRGASDSFAAAVADAAPHADGFTVGIQPIGRTFHNGQPPYPAADELSR